MLKPRRNASQEWLDGVYAHEHGRSVMKNPYIMFGSSHQWGAWRKGWLDAQQAKVDVRSEHRKRLRESMEA